MTSSRSMPSLFIKVLTSLYIYGQQQQQQQQRHSDDVVQLLNIVSDGTDGPSDLVDPSGPLRPYRFENYDATSIISVILHRLCRHFGDFVNLTNGCHIWISRPKITLDANFQNFLTFFDMKVTIVIFHEKRVNLKNEWHIRILQPQITLHTWF